MAVNLRLFEPFKRKLRQDDWSTIAIPTLTLIRKAIDEGRNEDAKELLDCLADELKHAHDLLVEWALMLLTFIGDHLGEDAVADALRKTRELGKKVLAPIPSLEQEMQYQVEHLTAMGAARIATERSKSSRMSKSGRL